MSRRMRRAIGGVLVFLAAWEFLVTTKILDFDYLPPPSAISVALIELTSQGEMFIEILHTVLATLTGWLISVLIGAVIGITLGLSASARAYSLASIEALRPLPGIAFVPVAILIFGFSLQTELMVIVIPTIWPVLVNTSGAFAAIPSQLHDVAYAFRMPPVRAVATVFAPAAAPGILVGLRLSLTLALIMAVAVEMIGNPMGLGYALVREAAALHPDAMFAYVFIIGVLGIVLNSLLLAGARAVLPGEFRRPRAEWSES